MSSISGSFNMSLDDKWRTRVPAKCKAVFDKEHLVITRGQNNCLSIMTESAKDELWKKVSQRGELSLVEKKALRVMSSYTFNLEEDGQGRFVVPPKLREYACITKDIVFVGFNDRVELWDATTWNSYSSVDDENEEEAINSCLATFGF